MTVLGARAPARAPGVELLGELSGSGYHETPGLVRRGDGQTVQVTPLLYALLDLVDGRRDDDALAAELGRRVGKTVAPQDVQHLLGKLEPLGLLGDPDGAAPEVQKATPLLGLKLKVVVSDPAVTRRITTPFAWLFRSWVVVPVLLAFMATCWWVLWEQGLASATRQAFDSPGLLLAVFALTVVSAGWHEFGHAAACRAAGATPGAMGAGLYLVWPAFYTDVDDSYRLSRWGRLVVDLGGLYFNALVAVGVTGLWLVVHVDALLLVVATQLLLMLRQLAPIVRADGYHILADLTGVPDLFQHIGPTLKGLLPQHWGRPQPLRRWARWVVRAWVLVVVPLLLWMLLLAVLLLPRLVATAWSGLGEQGSALSANAADGDVLGVAAGVLQVLALVLPVAAVSYLLVRVVRTSSTAAWTRTRGRPLARALVTTAGTALLALLVWAWWPGGQYEPVRADERGTIGQALQLRPAVYERPAQLSARMTPALALVPRDATAPVLLLVRPEGGGPLQTVLTSTPSEPGAVTQAQVLPFTVPEPAGEGDNQAVAVNTQDGTVLYDVAVALVKVVDGQRVDNRNEAYALASCRDCATVAVAFQVVLVIGQSDVQVPVNAAVAGNRDCVACLTTALAVQLVVTLERLPGEQVEAELAAAFEQLEGLEELTAELDLHAVYEQVQQVQAEVLAVLVRNGLVDAASTTTAVPSGGPSAGTAAQPTSPPSPAGPPATAPTAAPAEQPVGPSQEPEPTAAPEQQPESEQGPTQPAAEPEQTAPAPEPSAA
jgi:putative peptide zinc metalloprotease protein